MTKIIIERVTNGYILERVPDGSEYKLEKWVFSNNECDILNCTNCKYHDNDECYRYNDTKTLIDLLNEVAYQLGYTDNGFSKVNLKIGIESGDEIEPEYGTCYSNEIFINETDNVFSDLDDKVNQDLEDVP